MPLLWWFQHLPFQHEEPALAVVAVARLIAAAYALDITCAGQAERYAEMHWREYVAAARAVLGARG